MSASGRVPGVDTSTAGLLEVLDVSRQLAATSDLQRLLEMIEASALRVLDCERASVFLHDPETDELFSRVATGGVPVRFPAGDGFAGEAFRKGRVINAPDAYADPRFNPEIDRRTGFRTRCILSCPVRSWDNAVLGVLQFLNKRSGPFEGSDELLADTLSAQAGIALQRHFLLDELAQKQRYQHDLAIARRIQRDLLPHAPPKLDGYDIAGWNQPADATGGDFFDFQQLGPTRLALTLGDVTGHGLGPALVAAECRALVRALGLHAPSLNALVAETNALLSEDLGGERFVTAFFGRLDADSQRLEFLSAGHGPTLLLSHATGSIRTLAPHGPPLGVVPDFAYARCDSFAFEPGDVALILTDGFWEWPDASGRRPGSGSLAPLLHRHAHLPAPDLIAALYRDVHATAGGTTQEDDLTAVVVKRLE